MTRFFKQIFFSSFAVTLKMYSNILARSAMRSAAARRIARSDLYHFENTNGQVMCKVDAI